MTTRLTCADCEAPIPNGRAFLRTIAFEQVAFCSHCWAVRSGVLVPLPRFARPFSEVIAKVRRRA